MLTALPPGASLFLFISLQDWEGEIDGFLVTFLQGGCGDLRAKLTSLAPIITLENRGLVDYRAVIVAFVFVIFLCHVAFCLPFSPVRVLPLP